ncbi:MAG: hypothetical protein JW910_09375 [Anaerolineae bacterium]|nr:hypothetical protein [Anaerolineae bacterium]
MARIVLQSDEGSALRGASAAVQQTAVAIWNADPAQIEAAINTRVTDLATARTLLTVLILVGKDHERRLRALERD